jgi:hypothetical protein
MQFWDMSQEQACAALLCRLNRIPPQATASSFRWRAAWRVTQTNFCTYRGGRTEVRCTDSAAAQNSTMMPYEAGERFGAYRGCVLSMMHPPAGENIEDFALVILIFLCEKIKIYLWRNFLVAIQITQLTDSFPAVKKGSSQRFCPYLVPKG